MKSLLLSAILLASVLTQSLAQASGSFYATSVFVRLLDLGSGIDQATSDRVGALVRQGKANGAVVKASRKAALGQVVYCVQLREQGSRYAFIRDLAPSILKDQAQAGRARTQVLVGFSCNDISRASLQDLSLFYP
jgi:hypothetical protein